ncbi:hypothetical protein AQUCO_00201465v1 [Aquilegia coerulea]|uniref:Uncharacterized protein n=1 Tax=Aquilegia coerulea TaxID=218851 RepID=A0A2G5F875_AQUCA|nr:hypothetical protein AQUCO_00201465v1 [Aquilegia coerulea]
MVQSLLFSLSNSYLFFIVEDKYFNLDCTLILDKISSMIVTPSPSSPLAFSWTISLTLTASSAELVKALSKETLCLGQIKWISFHVKIAVVSAKT